MVRVAAFQGPYLEFPSNDGVRLVKEQLAACEAAGVEMLCCPEAIIGELANESDGDTPAVVALGVENGELAEMLTPLSGSSVTLVVGFTEQAASGELFNAAGVLICNDAHHIEPARVLVARGAAILMVASHGGHREAKEEAWRAWGMNVLVARAVDNAVPVVAADVAGRQGERLSHGTTAIIDGQGTVVARAEPLASGLVVADVELRRDVPGREVNGRDNNQAVTEAFLALWQIQ